MWLRANGGVVSGRTGLWPQVEWVCGFRARGRPLGQAMAPHYSLPFVLSLSKDERKEHAVSVVAGRIKPPGCERGIQGAKTT